MTNYTQPGTPVIEADHNPEGDRCTSTHEHTHTNGVGVGVVFAGAVTYNCTRTEGHKGPHETRGQWLTLARWNEGDTHYDKLRSVGINAKSKATHR